MSYVSPNLKLILPQATDDIDAAVIAGNYDKIDAALTRQFTASRLSADITKTATLTTSPIGSGIPVLAGNVYMMHSKLYTIYSGTSANIVLTLSGVTQNLGTAYGWIGQNLTGSIATSTLSAPNASITLPPQGVLTVHEISGIISPTATGTLQLNVGPASSVAGTLTVKAGSTFSLIDVT